MISGSSSCFKCRMKVIITFFERIQIELFTHKIEQAERLSVRLAKKPKLLNYMNQLL